MIPHSCQAAADHQGYQQLQKQMQLQQQQLALPALELLTSVVTHRKAGCAVGEAVRAGAVELLLSVLKGQQGCQEGQSGDHCQGQPSSPGAGCGDPCGPPEASCHSTKGTQGLMEQQQPPEAAPPEASFRGAKGTQGPTEQQQPSPGATPGPSPLAPATLADQAARLLRFVAQAHPEGCRRVVAAGDLHVLLGTVTGVCMPERILCSTAASYLQGLSACLLELKCSTGH